MDLADNVSTTVIDSNNTETRAYSESPLPAILQFVFGAVGNLVAIIALITSKKKHKWRPFYRLVAGLALTDGGGILLVFPTVLLRYASNFTFEFTKPLCNYSSFMFMFMLTSSAMIVCAMSFDRFMAILYPFRYNLIGKKHRANIMLSFIWLTSALISSLHLMGFGSNVLYYPGSWCFLNFIGQSVLDRASSLSYSLIGLLILFLTIFFNLLVVISLCRNMVTSFTSRRARRKSHIFNVVLLLAIVSVFAVCWTPLMIIIFGHATRLIPDTGHRELLVVRLGVTNSIIDPWIYILLRKENIYIIRRQFSTLCGKISSERSSVGNDLRPSSSESRQKRLNSTLSSGKTLPTTEFASSYELDTL